jgi:hypothetical protein
MHLMKTIRALIPILVWALSPISYAQQQCRVLDPDLQGSYSGPCVNGLAQGNGVAEGAAKYEGEFKAGRKHGKGVKTWPNGDRYEGEFADDRKEGQGVYTWGRGPWQGERYEGGYVADKRDGHGVYRWPSGDVYRGPWKADAFTGEPTEMMRARGKHELESLAAVAQVGAKVCRELEVGIGGRDWLRGVVAEARDKEIGVRIVDPGASGQARAGEVRWEHAADWTLCW